MRQSLLFALSRNLVYFCGYHGRVVEILFRDNIEAVVKFIDKRDARRKIHLHYLVRCQLFKMHNERTQRISVRRDNRIHGIFDGRSDLHKALGEDIKEHGASSAPCFYVRIIFEQEKLSVFRLCPTEASYLRHSRLCETGNLLLFLYRPRFPWLTTNLANRHFRIFRFWL